tara:strand:- start:5506 stop:6198 length:693 start_codon:yes stop_codon:yes gene_type:complete
MYVYKNVSAPDDLMHCFEFGNPNMLGNSLTYKGYESEYLTILGARKLLPNHACQMTATRSQLQGTQGEEILKYLGEQGFKTVSCHTNPNTFRDIYTFMAPPLGGEPVEVPKVRFPQDYSNNSSVPRSYPHSGCCCGLSEIVGLVGLENNQQTLTALNSVVGSIYTSDNPRKLIQAVVPRRFEQGFLGDMLCKVGFIVLYKWINPSTGVVQKLFGRSDSFKTVDTKYQVQT